MNEITSALANEPAKERTPAIIGAEIRMFVDAGRRVTLLCGIEIGHRLCEAKDMLQHGEWLPWLERETDMTDRTAQRYMRAFNEYGAAQQSFFGPVTNATTLSDLSISKALALLSVPESEREQFAADVDAEHLSARELEKAIRERDQAIREKTELENQLRENGDGAELALAEAQERADRLEEMAAEARAKQKAAEEDARRQHDAYNALQERAEIVRRENEELRARPATVERDEKAIEEAAAAAREAAAVEYEKKLEEAAKRAKDTEDALAKAKAAREKAEEKEKKARAALDGARAEAAKELQGKLDTAEREAREARAALEVAEKRAKLSDADTALFGEYFQTVQRDFARMAELLKKVREQDAERGEKLTAAMRAVLDKCRAELEVQ